MRWFGGRESGNVEYGSGGGGGGRFIGGGLGAIIITVIVYLFRGGNPEDFVEDPTLPGHEQQTRQKSDAEKDRTDRFIAVVLAETEDVWTAVFKDMGKEYQKPILNVFPGTVSSACGFASAATGPFYCPADEKIYLDKTFFDELSNRFQAPGDFANAYVIAHEVGHHVQHLLGTTDKYEHMLSGASSKREANRYSVMMELQADFYAGIWAHYMQKTDSIIEEGDINAALAAANAIGDDRLQKQTQGTVVPDAFTHGTSEQRMYWFRKGYETGDIRQGNTFKELGGN